MGSSDLGAGRKGEYNTHLTDIKNASTHSLDRPTVFFIGPIFLQGETRREWIVTAQLVYIMYCAELFHLLTLFISEEESVSVIFILHTRIKKLRNVSYLFKMLRAGKEIGPRFNPTRPAANAYFNLLSYFKI